jgi:putative transposase
LIYHSDRDVQYLSIQNSERLDENDIVASVGSRGDGQGHGRSFNSLYKCERNNPQCPWIVLDDVESASLGFIDWFDHRRLQCGITQANSYATPAEFEATYYHQVQPTADAATH